MSPETIRALAAEIVSQTILGNWLFYVVLASITVVLSAAGAFLSSYFSKRAEHAALAADFETVKQQLRETTALSESIKTDIKNIAERSEKLQWLKREKLEDAPKEEDPLLRASMLQKLYLPELDGEHAAFVGSVGEFKSWLAAGMRERLDAWKTTGVKSGASQALLDQYTARLNKVNATVIVVEWAAKELARGLNKV
jgi:hypothetical protein